MRLAFKTACVHARVNACCAPIIPPPTTHTRPLGGTAIGVTAIASSWDRVTAEGARGRRLVVLRTRRS